MQTPVQISEGTFERISYPLQKRALHVKTLDRVSPGFLKIVLSGEALGDFRSESFDDHVKVFIRGEDGVEVGRHYTVLAYDPFRLELSLLIGLHSEGLFANWALHLKSGDSVVVGGPKSSVLLPNGLDWIWLLGDATALPAIARFLSDYNPKIRVDASITLPTEDFIALPTGSAMQPSVFGTAEALIHSVAFCEIPDGRGYIWCAGEAELVSELQKVTESRSTAPARFKAYWKKGAPDN